MPGLLFPARHYTIDPGGNLQEGFYDGYDWRKAIEGTHWSQFSRLKATWSGNNLDRIATELPQAPQLKILLQNWISDIPVSERWQVKSSESSLGTIGTQSTTQWCRTPNGISLETNTLFPAARPPSFDMVMQCRAASCSVDIQVAHRLLYKVENDDSAPYLVIDIYGRRRLPRTYPPAVNS